VSWCHICQIGNELQNMVYSSKLQTRLLCLHRFIYLVNRTDVCTQEQRGAAWNKLGDIQVVEHVVLGPYTALVGTVVFDKAASTSQIFPTRVHYMGLMRSCTEIQGLHVTSRRTMISLKVILDIGTTKKR
jgi:hypothetical protein